MDKFMEEASRLIGGDRQDAYGAARESFAAYGQVFTGLLRNKLKPGEEITGADVTLLMTGLKLCREAHKPKPDNVVDAHGYLGLHAQVVNFPEEQR